MDALQEARDVARVFYEETAAQRLEDVPDKTAASICKTRKKKRSIEEVMADIPDPKTVVFEPMPIPTRHPPILHLPSSLDPDNPYALFTLFWPEKMWDTIARNTNFYAIQKRMLCAKEGQRPWHQTCAAELKVFVGILVYMGLHKSYAEHVYWRTDISQGPLHTCALHMSLNRYQAIKRYIHIAPVDPTNTNTPGYESLTEEEEWNTPDELLEKIWWYKIEPLASVLRNACRRLYTPFTDVSIDELMIRCYGRSRHTYKMPDKPIPQGYKLFGLADHGYMWDYNWSSRQIGITEYMKHKDLTPTGSMVLSMAKRLSKFSGQPFIIYLDNYFISIPLFQLLRELNIGAYGTTRAINSKNFSPLLREMKEDHAKVYRIEPDIK